MGLFTFRIPPNLPRPTQDYERTYMDQLLNVLNLYFSGLNAVQPVNLAKLNLDIGTLPTDADVANLRSGDVYRDTTAGNVLKIKV